MIHALTQLPTQTAGGRTPPMRSPSQLTSIPYGGRTPDNDPSLIPLQEPVLERDHEDTLKLLLGGVVDRRMSIINIQHGATPADSVGMPVAAWVLGECLLHWALRWRPAEVPHCTPLHPLLSLAPDQMVAMAAKQAAMSLSLPPTCSSP